MATAEKNRPAGYKVLREVTVPNINGENVVHHPGTVLSPWEVSDFLKEKIEEGSSRYRARFEAMTEQEVKDHREKATLLEGDRMVDGQKVSPPWPDYVGLHPEEILKRLQEADDLGVVEQVRKYEGAGMKRSSILDYQAPIEREPWTGYDELAVREVLSKLDVLGEDAVKEVQAYEFAHRKRPAILSYEKEAK